MAMSKRRFIAPPQKQRRYTRLGLERMPFVRLKELSNLRGIWTGRGAHKARQVQWNLDWQEHLGRPRRICRRHPSIHERMDAHLSEFLSDWEVCPRDPESSPGDYIADFMDRVGG